MQGGWQDQRLSRAVGSIHRHFHFCIGCRVRSVGVETRRLKFGVQTIEVVNKNIHLIGFFLTNAIRHFEGILCDFSSSHEQICLK